MSSQAFDMVPIQNENDGKVLGVLTEGTFFRTQKIYYPCFDLFFILPPPIIKLMARV